VKDAGRRAPDGVRPVAGVFDGRSEVAGEGTSEVASVEAEEQPERRNRT
jgi:hypothetical protein